MQSEMLKRSPGLLLATLTRGDRDYLTVFVSPLVRPTDVLFNSVHEVFDHSCVTMLVHERRPDSEAWQKEMICFRGQVHHICPGDDYEHICKGDYIAVAQLFN